MSDDFLDILERVREADTKIQQIKESVQTDLQTVHDIILQRLVQRERIYEEEGEPYGFAGQPSPERGSFSVDNIIVRKDNSVDFDWECRWEGFTDGGREHLSAEEFVYGDFSALRRNLSEKKQEER